MRTIKVRAQRKNSQEWNYFNLCEYLTSDVIPQPDILLYVHRNVGEFTGLIDKNVKEIYEGDVLKITLYDDQWITTVRDYYGTLIVDVEGCDWNITALSFLDDEAETEVIGNIYENPELLADPTAVL